MSVNSLVEAADADIIRKFPRYEGKGKPGFVVDFLGIHTSTKFIAALDHLDGRVEDYPVPMNFHATAIEWAGVLRAVLDARDEFVVVELGAGWAPWLVTAAHTAKLAGVKSVRLVGVEGSTQHYAFMLQHFKDNGLDPTKHRLLHGVVGPADGIAEFPVVTHPGQQWGAAAVLPKGESTLGAPTLRSRLASLLGKGKAAAAPAAAAPLTEKVTCYSIPSVLKPFDTVDLVHIDIQGDEVDVIASAEQALLEKVKWLVVGTHGRTIEQRLFEHLAARSWTMVSDESCMYKQHGQQMCLYRDGCQVWRNPRFACNPARQIRAAA